MNVMEMAALHISDAIGRASLSEDPYPYVVADNVLDPETFRTVLANWPDEFEHNEAGIDRHNYLLAGHDGSRASVPYWHEFADGVGGALVEAALARFAVYNEARFGSDAKYSYQLHLLQCGPDFTQHSAHTHHNHGPGWAMTFLLYLDDGEREDRGEVLSAPVKGSDWLNVVSQSGLNVKPVKRIAFKPNRIVAWLDGPMSFHGTDVLAQDPVNRRRMVRSHVIVQEPYLERALGTNSLGFLEACKDHQAGRSERLREILDNPGNCISALPRFTFAE